MYIGLKVLHQMEHDHCSLNGTLILVMCDNTTPNINPHIAYTHTHNKPYTPSANRTVLTRTALIHPRNASIADSKQGL
jgi:hypothetical protein